MYSTHMGDMSTNSEQLSGPGGSRQLRSPLLLAWTCGWHIQVEF